ncbi:hypothetical protein [Rhodomicrobium sp.]|uniref:hypothetical protein n=1 Tax=Rhodomicrobium sp. TaxID=2720632 RepID=UPI0039E5B049
MKDITALENELTQLRGIYQFLADLEREQMEAAGFFNDLPAYRNGPGAKFGFLVESMKARVDALASIVERVAYKASGSDAFQPENEVEEEPLKEAA